MTMPATLAQPDLFAMPPKPDYFPGDMATLPDYNGLTAVSTFSGCGGSSCGLRLAGWRVAYACEFIESARTCYAANFPATFVDGRDIREVKGADILNALYIERGELDLFEGSPPCSSFSSANTSKSTQFGQHKEKVYSDGVRQCTDDLFDQWLRLVDELRPHAVLAENVPGMLREGDGDDSPVQYLYRIQGQLRAMGYGVNAAILCAHDYGAATSRQRLIIWAIQTCYGKPPQAPSGLPHRYNAREALATCAPSGAAEMTWFSGLAPSMAADWRRIKDGKQPRYFNEARTLDRPVPTITNRGAQPGAAGILHPDECRKFTVTELAWLSGFPLGYRFTGSFAQQAERVGRAVCPPVYKAVGQMLAAQLKRGPVGADLAASTDATATAPATALEAALVTYHETPLIDLDAPDNQQE